MKGALSSPEIVLLRAFLSEPLRRAAFPFCKEPDLFETPVGARMAESIRNAFGEEAPGGRSSDWLHRVEPEELAQMLSDLTLDFRAENLSEERVVDSVKHLQESHARRKLETMTRAGADAEERWKILKNLKSEAPKTPPDSQFSF